ncbi:hypothetical protein GLYMA_16G007550v4 [Glycine max]|nr:hypothetical protein GLYMA_16G007550v4 [Glycine max]KAH1149335.1 hypothetical protein GYH30_043748 [Glycine max]
MTMRIMPHWIFLTGVLSHTKVVTHLHLNPVICACSSPPRRLFIYYYSFNSHY